MFDLPYARPSMDGSKISQIEKLENLSCKRHDAGCPSSSDVHYRPTRNSLGQRSDGCSYHVVYEHKVSRLVAITENYQRFPTQGFLHKTSNDSTIPDCFSQAIDI